MSNPLRNQVRKKRKTEKVRQAMEFLKAVGDRPIFSLAPAIQTAAETLLPKTKFESLSALVGTATAIGLQVIEKDVAKRERPLVEVVGNVPKSALEKLADEHREAEARAKGLIQ